MPSDEIGFVVPTYRLRDVGEMIEAYDEHFASNDRSVAITVFDDSTPASHAKYYEALERTHTQSELYYVGPAEKAAFFEIISERLRDRNLEPIVAELFRPSYGGNRNFTLVYTVGKKLISSDDDMRPWALMNRTHEAPPSGEAVCKGRIVKTSADSFVRRSFDIIGAFLEVLGTPASSVPASYARGELLMDTAMDLETNASKGLARENTLFLRPGAIDSQAIVKIAQTYRSGTADIDALDFVEMFVEDEDQSDLDVLCDIYVLDGFRPALTNYNWRMDCGVAGYDNGAGLPPFFPTRLRFEDYIHRLWVRQPRVAAAHVNAAQHHTRSAYMRNPLAAEVLNEELANLLKDKIRTSVSRLDDLGVAFGYDGAITREDSDVILQKVVRLNERVMSAAKRSKNAERAEELRRFGATLDKTFFGFQADFFHHNLAIMAKEEIAAIQRCLRIWPTILEIGYFHACRKGLPCARVKNQSRGAGVRRSGDSN